MIRPICLFLLVLFSVNQSSAQEASEVRSRSSIYADGGALFAGQFSLNYEYSFLLRERVSLAARAGAGYGVLVGNYGGPGGIAGITMLIGKESHHFEANGGVFVGYSSDAQRNPFLFPLADIGYRYQRSSGGFLFKVRAGYLGIGLGVGYAF